MYLAIEPKKTGEWGIHHTTLDGKWVEEVCPANQPLLVVLFKVVPNAKAIQGIAVLLGVGRFTATRVAVTVANTLALSLSIPCLGVTELDFSSLIAAIERAPVGNFILPAYSAEANIGTPKK